MAIGVKTLAECINASIDGVTKPLPTLQLASAVTDFETGFVYSVPNLASLPSAVCNEGRLVYVEDRCAYRISDGTSWTKDFTSTLNAVAVAWGSDSDGRLGDISTANQSSPVSVAGGFSDWIQISTGTAHTVAVRRNGTVWAWGRNWFGQLGNNNATTQSSPVSVIGGFTDWCQVSAGFTGTLGVRQNGTLWAWGAGNAIGNGSSMTCSRSSPVSVAGGFTDWCQASIGSNQAAAVRQNGTIWMWGSNNGGRLGDGTTVDRCSPVSVIGGFTDWCQVSTGGASTSAIRQNGTLWSWGYNGGRLGDGTSLARSSPVLVAGGFTDWCQVSVGGSMAAAVRQNGSLWTWGQNSSGELGDGTTITRSSPVSVVGGFTDWCQASSGENHIAAVRTNGTLWSWGRNNYGELGDNTSQSKSSPVSVIGGSADWYQVSAGNQFSAGVRGDVKGF